MRGNLIQLADRFGATTSFLCAAHCLALPFVLVLLPTLGSSALLEHGIEHVLIGVTSALAMITSLWGYQRHQLLRPFVFLLLGLGSLWLGILLDGQISLGTHAVLMSMGGLMLALVHWSNLRLTQTHRHNKYCKH